MSAAEVDTILLVAAVAAACAVPGVFLVLRKLALVGDAISHVLLFGIVLAFFIVADLDSPWLMVGATLSGVLTVALVETLQKTQLLKEDAAIGLVFPALFAIGTLLASMYFRGTHLDVDAVLLGHAEFVVQSKPIYLWGNYLGRAPTLLMTGMFVINGLLVLLFYKELKLCTFDAALAATLGFVPGIIHYGLMTVVSLTTVAAFDAVGPVLVVAFLVVPPATAYLLADRLITMLLLSVVIGVVTAILGVMLAFDLATSTAGTVAAMQGAFFALTMLASPKRGWVAGLIRHWQQRRRFHETMLTIHLLQHEGTPAEADEAAISGLHRHLRWTPDEVTRVVARAERQDLVRREAELLKLTATGRARARTVLRVG